MTWEAYQVVLHLRSPMHIGRGKIGNVQRTRGYVTGRVLWGALTQRLTRDRFYGQGSATRFEQYDDDGRKVHDYLAFTYFYPTTDEHRNVALWPWDESFRSRFLSTYASTALTYPQQSTDEGTLHEVEFISPHALDTGDPVYLIGYVFDQASGLPWKDALSRLQMGGERGYGWGKVEITSLTQIQATEVSLFGTDQSACLDGPHVRIHLKEDQPILAHALAADFKDNDTVRRAVPGIKGLVEPLVGRETHPKNGRFGVQLSRARICYVPGSLVRTDTNGDTVIRIGRHGVWEGIE